MSIASAVSRISGGRTTSTRASADHPASSVRFEINLAHPPISLLHGLDQLAGLVAVALLDGVLEEFQPVSEDLGLHPAVGAESSFAEERAHLEPASPVVPDRDEMDGVLLIAAKGCGEYFTPEDSHLVEDLSGRRV